jgi:hypothetical protein
LPRYLRLSRILVAAAALAAGCSSGTRPDVNADGAVARGICDNAAICTPDPLAFCQHTCTPDPGPRLVNCAKAEQNFEFNGIPLWTFEEDLNDPAGEPLALGMYSYTDNSTTIKTFTQPGNLPGERIPKTWQPRTATLPRCSDKPNDKNQAIHIQGGPFLSWGGGVGIGMKNVATGGGPAVVGGNITPEDATRDWSAWEGVSFWARRGPDSQVGFRVLVGDKYTDDDISFLMYREDPTKPRYCERVRECACLNHKTCAPVDLMRANGGTGDPTNPIIPSGCRPTTDHLGDKQTMMFCGAPEVISGAGDQSSGGSQCNTCEGSGVGPGIETKCNEKWPAFPDDCGSPDGMCPGPNPPGTDIQFYGKPCSPHTMRNGIFSYWCFDPAKGEDPAETTEQCGDHWTNVVNLTSEWQFYTVPFNSLLQQGWAKRSAKLDTTAISVLRFTWDGGWVDFWIDQVNFYRHKPPPPPQ